MSGKSRSSVWSTDVSVSYSALHWHRSWSRHRCHLQHIRKQALHSQLDQERRFSAARGSAAAVLHWRSSFACRSLCVSGLFQTPRSSADMLGACRFAWTVQPSVHWIVSCIATVPFGFGMVLVFLSIVNYTVDSYLMVSFSPRSQVYSLTRCCNCSTLPALSLPTQSCAVSLEPSFLSLLASSSKASAQTGRSLWWRSSRSPSCLSPSSSLATAHAYALVRHLHRDMRLLPRRASSAK